MQSLLEHGSGTKEEKIVTFPSLHKDPVVPDTGGQKFELTYLHLHIGERVGGVDRRGGPRVQQVGGVSYRGPRMDKALEILATSVVYVPH